MNKQYLGTFDKVHKTYKHRADNSAPEILAVIAVVLFVTSMALAIISIGA